MLLVITIFTLILTLGSVTYAFFNYTRTGQANTLKTGNISFNSTQDNTISLTNVFPTSSTNLNSTNSDTVTINITGDTTYSEGIEYKVTLDQVNNTINGKEIPISFNVTASNLGTKDSSYYTNRGGATPIYNLTETGQVEDGKYILVGYISQGSTGVNGSIDVTAFIDTDRVAISDTVSRIDNGNLIYGETTGEWIAGRTVFTTSEWNSFQITPISFKVKVEANEGIWVEEEKYIVLKNLNDITEWQNIRTNISSIEFHKDGIAPSNSLKTIDVTDVTSAGPVTLYTVDDGLGNNKYKAIVVANDTIYAPNDSTKLFARMENLIVFNSENFKVDNVSDMNNMFNRCSKLSDISSLSQWKTSNVTDMLAMFFNCSSLTNLDGLYNFDTSNVTADYGMYGLFYGCTNLSNINGLINWNTSNVKDMEYMFYNCLHLENVDALLNWNTSNVTNMEAMFYNCQVLANIDGLINWDTSEVTSLQQMFYNCQVLENIDSLSNWNISNVINMGAMFASTFALIDFSPLTNWNTENVVYMGQLFTIGNGKTRKGDSIIDVFFLSNWNTSNVIDMSYMFHNVSISSYIPFKNWNVGKVQNFSNMFNQTDASTVITLAGLENWDVSSATDMSAMFLQNVSLTDASAINNWNINASINFGGMFGGAPSHPEFTNVFGTWDSEGTFIPNA